MLQLLSVGVLSVLLVTRPALAVPLKVSLVSHATSTEENDQLRAVFLRMLDTLRAKHPAFPYTGVDMVPIDYGTSCSVLSADAIASLTPLKYLECSKEFGGRLEPLLSVKKVHDPDAYFSAVFIASRQSPIETLTSSNIRTLYLVDQNSASGYVAPLLKLWEAGVIPSPTVEGAKVKGWRVELVGRAPEVINRVQADHEAIGAVGTPALQQSARPGVVTLLRYYTLPQDVVVASGDLHEYAADIAGWLRSLWATDGSGVPLSVEARTLEGSSAQITGVAEFSLEEKNAIAELGQMHDRVLGRTPLVLPSDLTQLTLDDLLGLMASLKLTAIIAAIVSLTTVVSSVFGLGYRWGRRRATG